MIFKKMKIDLESIIDEMIEEKKECGNNSEKNDELMTSWDDIIKEYRIIADYLERFASEEEEKEVINTMRSLHYVRCFGIRPYDANKQAYEDMKDDDSGGIW